MSRTEMWVISYSLKTDNIKFINSINTELERKGVKIGNSAILQKILELLKETELVSLDQLKEELLKEKFVQTKTRALDTYLEKVSKQKRKLKI